MLGNTTIELITIVKTQNEIGNTLETKAYKTIFADELSVMQSEFYQASAAGLKPELKFEILQAEYSNEEFLRYNSKEYRIIRTFKKGIDKLEITCQGIVGTESR